MESGEKKHARILVCLMLVCVMGSYGCNKISAAAQPGGTISPAGTVWVWKGSSKAFTMTPGSGNTIADVQLDGATVPIWSTSTYTFLNVQADHSIVVSFITDTTHYKIFNVLYNTAGTKLDNKCLTCHNPHATPTALAPLANAYGSDVNVKRTAGYTKYQSLKLVEPLDSDGDGYDNIMEINARTYPGDPGDHP